jgi:hypothetical protein
MTERPRFGQAPRSAEHDRIRHIEAARVSRLSPDERRAFRRPAGADEARRPRPGMAPGMAPSPPRPGREQRELKEAAGRRSRWM